MIRIHSNGMVLVGPDALCLMYSSQSCLYINWSFKLENDAGARITNTLHSVEHRWINREKKDFHTPISKYSIFIYIIAVHVHCTWSTVPHRMQNALPALSLYMCIGFSIFYPSLYRSYVYQNKCMQQTIELVRLFDRDRMKW